MHDFIFNLPRSAEKLGSVGLFSEESGESVHNAMNKDGRVYACVRDIAKKQELMATKHNIKNKLDRSITETNRKKCPNCGEFYKGGNCSCSNEGDASTCPQPI